MFGPLNFKEKLKTLAGVTPEEAPCPLCKDVFNLQLCLPIFLQHLLEVHSLVIEEVQNIPKLEWYLDYWKKRFNSIELSKIVPFVNTANGKYFLLSTLMKEDKELRSRLALENAMEHQEFERNDENFKKECLFCRLQHKGTRGKYLEHLSLQHNLQLGNPQNLVFVDDLIGCIESKLCQLQCIYCEKTFPDRAILKEHMRKKLHKRINPSNKCYDKFFIVNYAIVDQSEGDAAIVPDADAEKNVDEEYFDWIESKNLSFTCLFCPVSEEDVNLICLHMQAVHAYNFQQLTSALNFYQRVKLINYLRKQVRSHKCPTCNDNEEIFENNQHLLVHMQSNQCFKLPDEEKFDQPEYYFPTYENDAFLYFLEDLDE